MNAWDKALDGTMEFLFIYFLIFYVGGIIFIKITEKKKQIPKEVQK
jgi:cbb3-type cytochrome oxidase subunit 3|tara:strand:- start:284 stop:421 length:138 start_codon:yes stop_codon:yes gene_type:complete